MERCFFATCLLAIATLTANAQFPSAIVSEPVRSATIVPNPPTMSDILAASDDGFATIVQRRFRLFGGYDFQWLQPRFSNNVSAVVTMPSGSDAYAFQHDHELASNVWVAVQNDRCNGIRASYWYIDSDAPTQVNFATAAATPISLTITGAGGNLSRTAVANVGDAMTSNHHLQMRTIDIEGTHQFRFTCTEILAGFGLRYAKTHQRAHAVATDGTGALTELVCQDLEFQGFGPTLSGELVRHLRRFRFMCSRMSCFANTRTSLLMGEQEQEIVLVTAGGATLAEDRHSQDDFMPIIEIGGGIQWAAQPYGTTRWVVRSEYRASSWFGTGGPVDADSDIALHGVVLSLAADF